MEALSQPTALTKGATRGCPLSLPPSHNSDQQVVFKANVIKGADQGDYGKTEDIRSRHNEEGLLGGKLQKTIWNASGIFNGFSKYSILMRYQYMAYFSPILFLGV